MAALPALLGRTQLDLRRGSPFLRDLARREAALPTYEIVPYARLGDVIVGAANSAPLGITPLWVPNLLLEDGHLTAFADPPSPTSPAASAAKRRWRRSRRSRCRGGEGRRGGRETRGQGDRGTGGRAGS